MTGANDISIAFHIGGPEPQGDPLVQSLRKSATELSDKGVMVRPPAKYREALSDLMDMQVNGTLTPEDQETFIAKNVKYKRKDTSHFIMSDPNLLGRGLDVLGIGSVQASAGQKVLSLKQAIGIQNLELFIGICHPASLLSTEFEKQDADWDTFIAQTKLSLLRWSFVVQDILDKAPDTPVYVWCTENTALTWPEIFCAITGLDDTLEVSNELEALEGVLPSKAYDSLKNFIAERPHLTEAQRREVCTSFYDCFASEEDTAVEIDLPGCSQDQMDTLSANYEKDVEALKKMVGVTFIG